MSKVSYKNSNNDDVVTFDLSTEDGKRDHDRIKTLENWSKVATEDNADVKPVEIKRPAKNASRATLLEFALKYASDAEQATLPNMTDDQLRAFVDGDGLGAGPAAGV